MRETRHGTREFPDSWGWRLHPRTQFLARSLLAWSILLTFLGPYLYLIFSSFKPPEDIQAYPPRFLGQLTLYNYVRVIRDVNLAAYVKNSAIVASATGLLALALSLPAAYALSRRRFRGKEVLANTFLVLQMAPPIALVFSFLTTANQLGITDTLLGLVLLYLPWNISFAVWMLRSFLTDLPRELEEAALVDGCTVSGAFLRVTMPLLLPGLLTTGIFIFIGAWNEFVIAFFLTRSAARTLPTTVDFFLTYGMFQFGPMFAAGVIGTIPIVLFGIVVRRYYLTGITAGALKG